MYRIIPTEINFDSLAESHRSKTFDHSGLRTNPSTGIPIPQLMSLVKDGIIGELNHLHFSLMGGIIAPMRLIKKTIPDIIDTLIRDKVDVVLCVPV